MCNAINKICEWCNKEHSSKYRFCCRSCSASYNNSKRLPPSLELKHRISKTLKEKSRIPRREWSKICPICSNNFLVNSSSKNRTTCGTKECRYKNLSNSLKLSNKSGGYRKGSGRSKHGWYDGIHFDSTYELAFYIHNKSNNIKRNYKRIPYRNTYYIPDFEMNNKFIEIKGYHTPTVDDKISEAAKQGYIVQLVGAVEMKPIILSLKSKFNVKCLSELYNTNFK